MKIVVIGGTGLIGSKLANKLGRQGHEAVAASPSLGVNTPSRAKSTGGDEKGMDVSFQAYLDNIEEKTGLTPRQFIALAHEKGLDDPAVKAGTIVDWLKEDYDLGRGHAMALVHVIKKGPQIDAKHVGSGGTHRDPSDMLWLDGRATNPQAET